jgi:hypothetical protein
VLQDRNQIGDDGAGGLGEGLKVNISLQKLLLVSHSVFYFELPVAEATQGEGGGGSGLHSRVSCRSITKSGTTVLEGWARG